MTFAERLRELRIENNKTLDDIGQAIGVGRATIYKYEHEIITNIPPEKIDQLAKYFKVTRPYLMGWSDDRNVTIDKLIILPDNDVFVQAYSVMTDDDRKTLTDIFIRAYEKVQEKNRIEQNL